METHEVRMCGRGCGCWECGSSARGAMRDTRTHTGCHHGTVSSPLRLSVPLLGPAVWTHTTPWLCYTRGLCFVIPLHCCGRAGSEGSRAEGRRTRGHFGSLHRSGAPRTRGGERQRGGGAASRSLRSMLSSSSPGSNFSLCPRGEGRFPRRDGALSAAWIFLEL